MLICVQNISECLELNIPIIVEDDADNDGVITKRLIALMKKHIRILGDFPFCLLIDPAQFLDICDKEDYYIDNIKKDFNLEVRLIPRKVTLNNISIKNRFCIMTGKLGKSVIGIY